MEKISIEFVMKAVGGTAAHPKNIDAFETVTTDTRSITPGSLFIALRGERFDGNDFLEEALAKGAAACVAERPCDKGPTIVVGDTHAALLALAGAYRGLFDIPVVGVTGSVGKTSTKEMIACVLARQFATHKNEGNLNNEIGMPLSVLRLERGHGAAVFEMGMSGFGEISHMARVARPTVGVITNIGISHIEKLGTQENILKAKLEILDGMAPGGKLVLNGDDRLLKTVGSTKVEKFTYGIEHKDCDVFADNIKIEPTKTDFDIHFGGRTVGASIPVCGRHNVYNALAAFLCGVSLGLSDAQIVEGLGRYETAGMRQRIEQFHGITLIKDCYNASPDSMASAFDVLSTVRASGRRVAVLADMLELGETARAAHLEVGRKAFQAGVDALLAYGDNARYYCEGFCGSGGEQGNCTFYGSDRKQELARALAGRMKTGDAVLFKGSRGMKLEETITEACERWKQF